MTASTFVKPVPASIAIFGASGHIGGPIAHFLRFHAPHVRLRLISSSADKMDQLRKDHPYAEVVHANYYDAPSVDAALAGIQGLVVITTTGTDEARAMTNVVAAVRKSGTLVHMVRLVGVFPDGNLDRIPQALRDFGMGLEIQHPIARRVLDEARMPVTYFNIGASYMDNYLRLADTIQEEGVLCWHDRRVPYIDPREVGEAAARILLSDDARHLHQFYTLNNGQPGLRSSDVARMMSEVLLRPVGHDGSRDAFLSFFEPLVDLGAMPAAVPEYLWNMFELEEANAHVWVPNQFLERVLGRQPNTMRAWLQEHRAYFGDDTRPALLTGSPSRPQARVEGADVPPGDATAIDGVWQCTVATPMGKEPNELVVRSTPQGHLEGEMRNLQTLVSLPLQDGRFEGHAFTWTLQMTKPIALTLLVEVRVDGDTLTGFAKAGPLGKVSIEGTRRR